MVKLTYQLLLSALCSFPCDRGLAVHASQQCSPLGQVITKLIEKPILNFTTGGVSVVPLIGHKLCAHTVLLA